MSETETFEDRVLHYRAFGYWPREAPMEPDDIKDASRDSAAARAQLSQKERQRLRDVYHVTWSRA